MKILFCSGMEESHLMFNEVTVTELRNKGHEVEVVWVKSPRELGNFLAHDKISDIDVLVSESDFRHIGLSDHSRDEDQTVKSNILKMIDRHAPHIKTVFLRHYNSGHQQSLEARDKDRWSIDLSYRIRKELKN